MLLVTSKQRQLFLRCKLYCRYYIYNTRLSNYILELFNTVIVVDNIVKRTLEYQAAYNLHPKWRDARNSSFSEQIKTV